MLNITGLNNTYVDTQVEKEVQEVTVEFLKHRFGYDETLTQCRRKHLKNEVFYKTMDKYLNSQEVLKDDEFMEEVLTSEWENYYSI